MDSIHEVQLGNQDVRAAAPGNLNAEPALPPGAETPAQARMRMRQAYYPEDPRTKSPALAMVLSLMPGLGQVYVGYYQQAFINILVVASIIAALNHNVPNYMEPFLGLFLAFYWLYNLVDAGRRASFYNQALAGVGPTEIPLGPKAYEGKGSVAGGIVLIAVGLLFFLHTRFGISLDWLEQWWPMALILMGAYLLYTAFRERKEGSQDSLRTGTV